MESVLSTTERDRVVHTTSKLQRLDGVVHVWVRDARPLRHGVESTMYAASQCKHEPKASLTRALLHRPAVPLKLSASMQVAELRVGAWTQRR